jgi:L-idonate 5-dehydrogenase
MRALAYYGINDLREEEWPKPTPGPGQVRVAIKAVCLSGVDVLRYSTGGFGDERLPRPFVLGHDAAGLIDAVGAGVQDLPQGTPVVLEQLLPCGHCAACRAHQRGQCHAPRMLGWPPTNGALAEYVVVPAENAVPVAARVAYAELACIAPLALALHAAATARVAPDATVAIVGAGGMGLLCLLAARHAGARTITVIDPVAGRAARARQRGADAAYTSVAQATGADGLPALAAAGVDVVFETAGSDAALADALAVAGPGARLALIGMSAETTRRFPLQLARRKEAQLLNISHAHHTTRAAAQLIETGAINLAPLISRRMPWDKAEEAFALAARHDEDTIRISLEPEELDEPFHP